MLIAVREALQKSIAFSGDASGERLVSRSWFRYPKGHRCQNHAYRVRCDIHVRAVSIEIRDKKARWNKQEGTSMKYIQVIFFWGSLPLVSSSEATSVWERATQHCSAACSLFSSIA